MNEQPKMECPNCANPPHEGPCRRKRVAEPIAPLSDAHVRELTQLTRNGSEVVAMASEVALSRERIALLEAERACLRDWARCAHRFAWAHDHGCPRREKDETCTCGLDEFLARPRMVIDGYRATFRAIALALGLPADAEPDAVLAAVREAAADRARLRDALVAILKRVALVSPYYEMARGAIDGAIDAANEGAKR